MKIAVHQPNFIPYLGYFEKISQVDKFVFMDDFQYTKRSYVNRNKIKTPDGWVWLTVPVKMDGLPPINQVEIATQKFKQEHLKTLQFMYRNSPFYSEIIEWIEEKYQQDWQKLSDLNISLLLDIMSFLDINVEVEYTSNMDISAETTTGRIIDICKAINADFYLSGKTGNDYLETELFEREGIGLGFHNFEVFEYKQQFNGFEPYMSVLDYLMNEGKMFWK